MREIPFDPKCYARHLGVYAIQGSFMQDAVAQIKMGTWPTLSAAEGEEGRDLFMLTPDGIAIVPLAGPIMKGTSKFPHTNSLDARRAVRAAVADSRVKAIVLHIDSPGGSSAGTQELADDVHAAAQVKPTIAHIDDLGASAAYWVASQASSVSVNESGWVGSIGVFAVVHDTSKAAEMAGVEVKVLATGKFKGEFVDGAAVPDHHLEDLQGEVDAVFTMFLVAVERGRGAKGLSGSTLTDIADGRVFIASDALQLGLVDRVASLDDVITDLAETISSADSGQRAARARRNEKLRRLRR